MTERDFVIEGQNITLVYDALDLRELDPGVLKRQLSPMATIMDTPQMIVVVDPSGPLIIQFVDNRIRLSLQKKVSDVNQLGKFGRNNLWNLALDSHRLAQKQKRGLIAYGFNYDVVIDNYAQDVAALLNKMFIKNPDQLADTLDAEAIAIVPRIKFSRDDAVYDLILVPIDGTGLKAHLNVHFATSEIPNQKNMKSNFGNQFAYLSEHLAQLGLVG